MRPQATGRLILCAVRLRRRGDRIEALAREGRLEELAELADRRDLVLDRSGRTVDLAVPRREAALRALSQFYGPPAIRPLAAALRDPDPRLRRAALEGLRDISSVGAGEELLRVLAEAPPGHGADEQDGVLEALLEREDRRLPERFAHLLVEHGEPMLSAGGRDALAALVTHDERGPGAARSVAEELVPLLIGEDAAAAGRAEQVLGWVAPEGVDVLLAQLEGSAPPAALVRLLGATGDLRASELLVGLLHDGDPTLRRAAADALGRIKDTRAVEALLYATRDPELSVREAALGALDAMGAAAVVLGVSALAGASLHAEAPAPVLTDSEPQPWAGRVLERLVGRGPES